MSQVDEILNNLTEDEIATYTANPETEEHIIIDNDRRVIVPTGLKRIAVQHDHNIETVTFDCPRYWDGIDMSGKTVYINYMLRNGVLGSYVADNVTVDEIDDTLMHFEWTISNNVTSIQGNISFLVCIKEVDDDGNELLHWNSELNSEMYVSEGLECDEEIIEKHADVITQLLVLMDKILMADSPILDKTLTVSGLAADAKVTGDSIEYLRNLEVDKIQDQNTGKNVKVWVGSAEEYKTEGKNLENTLVLITDEEPIPDRLFSIESNVEKINNDVENINNKMASHVTCVGCENYASGHYHKLGTLGLNMGGRTTNIFINSGTGANGAGSQNIRIIISIKKGTDEFIDDEKLENVYGVSCEIFGASSELTDNLKVYVVALNRNSAEIWLYAPSIYHHADYTIGGYYASWIDGGDEMSYETPTGKLQDVVYYDMTQAGTRR